MQNYLRGGPIFKEEGNEVFAVVSTHNQKLPGQNRVTWLHRVTSSIVAIRLGKLLRTHLK